MASKNHQNAERFFGFIPRGVEWELSIFCDARGLISRVSAKKRRGVFFVFCGVFVLLGGCFCAFWGCFFVFRALTRFFFGFFFGGGMSKTGNSRSAFSEDAKGSMENGGLFGDFSPQQPPVGPPPPPPCPPWSDESDGDRTRAWTQIHLRVRFLVALFDRAAPQRAHRPHFARRRSLRTAGRRCPAHTARRPAPRPARAVLNRGGGRSRGTPRARSRRTRPGRTRRTR